MPRLMQPSRLVRLKPDLVAVETGGEAELYDCETDEGEDLRISSIRNRSVRSARRWIEALRLSMTCELMDGWARTSSTAAKLLRASRSSTVPNAAA